MNSATTLFAVCKQTVRNLDEGNAEKHDYETSILQIFTSRDKAEVFKGEQRVELNAHRWEEDEENFPHLMVPASSVTSWEYLSSGDWGVIYGYVATVKGQKVRYTDCVRFSIVARRVNTLFNYRKAFACRPYNYRNEINYSNFFESRGGRIADHVIRGAYSRPRE